MISKHASKQIYCLAGDPMAEPIVASCRDSGLAVTLVPPTINPLDLCFFGRPVALLIQNGYSKSKAISIVERIRARGDTYPIIIFSEYDEKTGTADALTAGADDFVYVSPTDVEAITLKLRSILQRRSEFYDETFIRVGPLNFDTVSSILWFNNKRLQFAPLETSMLEILMKYPGRSLEKKRIYEAIFAIRRAYRPSVIDKLAESINKQLSTKIEPKYLLHPDDVSIRLGPEIGLDFLSSISRNPPEELTRKDSNIRDTVETHKQYNKNKPASKKNWTVAGRVRLQQLEDKSVALGPTVDKLWREGTTSTRGIAKKLMEYEIPTLTGRSKWHHPQVKTLLLTLGYNVDKKN